MKHVAFGFSLALLVAGTAEAGLTAQEATETAAASWADYANRFASETAAELEAGRIDLDGAELRFHALSFEGGEGEACTAPCEAEDGRRRPLFISLHGGGGTASEYNDEQWANQLELGHSYAPAEGIYIAPRAPTDEWDCWHGPTVDALLVRLIDALVAAGTVDPDRVYLMGYSAGGDGVYQLAPRMADRFAAAAMMAGHPNGVSVENLRNLPFAIHMGAQDSAYDRAAEAARYGRTLAALRAADPEGYRHQVRIHANKGHWMDLEDRVAVPWMEGFVRDAWPMRVVWRLGRAQQDALYWLALPEGGEDGDGLVASVDGQTITLEGPSGRMVEVRLSAALLDLDESISIVSAAGETLFEGPVERSADVILWSIEQGGDPSAIYEATVTVTLH
ncbi:MAG: dienelactone hydrolase family protein [Aquimonas sp.]|nr:dienelactone hydrolase family protein [Aquimonas sp.]